MNEEKTEILMVCPSQRTRDLVTHVEIGDICFKVVNQFSPYLEALIDDKYYTKI